MFSFNLNKACLAQEKLAQKIRLERLRRPLRLIGGADFAVLKNEKIIGAALIVLDAVTFEIVEKVFVLKKVNFPYLPGFLCFREGPICLQALKKVQAFPDVWFLDGNGLAHPRKMGLATFVGVKADVPTIGCAKTAYFPYEEPARFRGAFTIYRNHKGEKVGYCLRTRTGVNPIFVSPGHRVNFEDCLFLALEFSRFRLPEPLRQAHLWAQKMVKS